MKSRSTQTHIGWGKMKKREKQESSRHTRSAIGDACHVVPNIAATYRVLPFVLFEDLRKLLCFWR